MSSYAVSKLADGRFLMNDGSISAGNYQVSNNIYGNVGNSRSRESELARLSGAYQQPQNDPYNPVYRDNNPQGSVLGWTSSPDLSNPAKQTAFANANGYDNYQQYLDAQNKVDNALGRYQSEVQNTYNDLEGKLDPWRAEQEKGINDLYSSGLADINLQEQSGLQSLSGQRQRTETNQIRNLKDLANSMGQSFNTFSNQLGVMGAGDSSAAKVMLPYALSRLEAGQRGQITRQSADAYAGIDDRESQLKTAVMSETNRLNQTRIQEMNKLGEWFNNAKFQIAQMKGQDVRGLAENVLSQALQEANRINSDYTARQNSLRDWATSVSQNVGQLKSNLAQVSDPSLLGNLPQFAGLNTNMSGYRPANYSAPVGFGFGNTQEEKLI